MRCYGIAVSELLEIGRKDTALPQMNQSFLIDARDRDNLPVCCPKTGLMAIGGNQKPVTSGNFNLLQIDEATCRIGIAGQAPKGSSASTCF